MEFFKLLFLVRHGKAGRNDNAQDDYGRPLSTIGIKEAARLAKNISFFTKPEIIISATSFRTVKTSEIISNKINFGKEIIYSKELYPGEEESLCSLIKNMDNSFSKAMIVSHNPGITTLINKLTGESIANVPPAGCAVILSRSKSWSEITEEKARLLYFHYPKEDKSLSGM